MADARTKNYAKMVRVIFNVLFGGGTSQDLIANAKVRIE